VSQTAEAPPDDQKPRSLDPKVATVWTIQAGIAALVVTLVVGAAEIGARLVGLSTPWPTGLAIVLVAAVGGLMAWRLPRAAWRRWRYELAPEALELRHGLLERVHSAIPYYRLQYVDIKQGPIERALGLARLVVHTAAAGSDAEIPGIAEPEADSLRQVLLARAGIGDAV
jgi:uncharacterized protein